LTESAIDPSSITSLGLIDVSLLLAKLRSGDPSGKGKGHPAEREQDHSKGKR
jgi:hypothetical protein